MNWYTTKFRENIVAAKQGKQEAIRVLRMMLENVAIGDNTPTAAIIELSECLLEIRLRDLRSEAEQN